MCALGTVVETEMPRYVSIWSDFGWKSPMPTLYSFRSGTVKNQVRCNTPAGNVRQ